MVIIFLISSSDTSTWRDVFMPALYGPINLTGLKKFTLFATSQKESGFGTEYNRKDRNITYGDDIKEMISLPAISHYNMTNRLR